LRSKPAEAPQVGNHSTARLDSYEPARDQLHECFQLGHPPARSTKR
jgi:hypothetical protein